MTLTEKQEAVLAGVAEIGEREGDENGSDAHQILIGRLYQEVYQDAGEEQPDLDDEARVILESLVQMGLVEHRPPTKPEPELTEAGRHVHEEGPDAVEFDHVDPDKRGRRDRGESDDGGGLLSKLSGLFS